MRNEKRSRQTVHNYEINIYVIHFHTTRHSGSKDVSTKNRPLRFWILQWELTRNSSEMSSYGDYTEHDGKMTV
jgi:hypothetical protein